MAINVEVKKTKNENNLGLLKKFSRKVIESGVINKIKSERYESRNPSDYTKKKNKLKVLKKRNEFEKMYKLGKVVSRRKK